MQFTRLYPHLSFLFPILTSQYSVSHSSACAGMGLKRVA